MVKHNFFAVNGVRRIADSIGNFCVVEWEKDASNSYYGAMNAYYASQMDVRKKQLVIDLKGNGAILQAGAMQMITGNVDVQTNVQGVGDLVGRFIGSRVTGETAIKPRYVGTGTIVLEPTYKYILLQDMKDWTGGLVIEDGLFLACSDTVNMQTVARSTLSSAVLGNEGLFNTCLTGQGVVALESYVPYKELFVVELQNDTIKIDGSMAIAWSQSLQFTVERTTRTLIGSAASGEGLVNVYRGTGRVLIAPVAYNPTAGNSQVGSSGVNVR